MMDLRDMSIDELNDYGNSGDNPEQGWNHVRRLLDVQCELVRRLRLVDGALVDLSRTFHSAAEAGIAAYTTVIEDAATRVQEMNRGEPQP